MSGATGPARLPVSEAQVPGAAASLQFLGSRLSGAALRRGGQALGLWACGNHRGLERHSREAQLSEVGERLPDHRAEFLNARPEQTTSAGQRRNPPLL